MVMIDCIITILNYSITADKDVIGNKFIVCCLICVSDLKQKVVSFQFVFTLCAEYYGHQSLFVFCIDGLIVMYFKMMRLHMEFLRKK
jgi:hypothetical protein